MDRESYHTCCSLVKIPRQSYEQFWSSHFVDYIDKELSYSKFFKKYLLPNHPCMFSRRFTEDWKCRKQWVTEDGKPNFQKLLQEFGKCMSCYCGRACSCCKRWCHADVLCSLQMRLQFLLPTAMQRNTTPTPNKLCLLKNSFTTGRNTSRMVTHHPKDVSILKTGTCQGHTLVLISLYFLIYGV